MFLSDSLCLCTYPPLNTGHRARILRGRGAAPILRNILALSRRKLSTIVFHVFLLHRERQLRLYGHVARLPVEDPAHRILSC